MGGCFSTRWNGVPTRQTTDPLLRIDIGALHRQGALIPGTTSWIEWSGGRQQPSGSIQLVVTVGALTLTYRVHEQGGEWWDIGERVTIVSSPCHYGGSRPWFQCPGCHTRRRVLHSVAGRFRCRACHDLAYSSTREDDLERSLRRIATLHVRLGTLKTDPVTIPPKPLGMWRSTYKRIVDELTREQNQLAGHIQSHSQHLNAHDTNL
jgi:hypothetical protein